MMSAAAPAPDPITFLVFLLLLPLAAVVEGRSYGSGWVMAIVMVGNGAIVGK
jgi:hypothetical protein